MIVQDPRIFAPVLRALTGALMALFFGTMAALAAPYAAMVMDARTGEVLHSRNADTKLHPASLTKMMTLYVAFEAIRNDEITLDTKVRVSRNAASKPPSKLGLKSGQRIALRFLIRASAVKSANDAATVIAEAISGSEAAFTRRMTRTARAMGMKNTTFKNPHGLTQSGHLSTARDMTILGRHMLYDYPQYYNLFSRRSTNAGVATVNNTNRRLLNAYRGADGIKTGYTRAAGFNLVASAQRGNERIIATMFGGSSGAARNARVAELLDMGFARAPSRAPLRKPQRPAYAGNVDAPATTRTARALTKTPVPRLRPGGNSTATASASLVDLASTAAAPIVPLPNPTTDELRAALGEVATASATTTAPAAPKTAPASAPEAVAVALAAASIGTAAAPAEAPSAEAAVPEVETAETETPPADAEAPAQVDPTKLAAVAPNGVLIRPRLRPRAETATAQIGLNEKIAPTQTAEAPVDPSVVVPAALQATDTPAAAPAIQAEPAPPVIVTRLGTSGRTDWGVSVGRYTNQFEAEKALLRVALAESATLSGAVRKVANSSKGWEARFLGLTRENAELACRRLVAQSYECNTRGPS